MGQSEEHAALLYAVADGDRVAFELLYRHYAPWLTARLRYRCADAALVDDIVQEVFVSVWRGASRYRQQDGADVAGWLWRICARRLADATRRHSSRQRLQALLVRFRGHDDGSPSAEDSVLGGLAHGDLGAAIERLPTDLRAVLAATVLDGMTSKEASVALSIPEGTVKSRASRARRRLREELA
ncbi:RNA polymerase sigma factor [Streptomyces sp. CBMA156]|uniref:RNA polymerase sigma factor n=1 Tax=Streptomyces sp. CBMA156 TaxID=1930280 RepID=UPI001662125B|nr:RNA polymerase sigma factor [Streptomyces sp. CBMA156]MBD0671947.1 RNA polymerase subunit sigma-24 [Streptomyces sp. CBMA156]